jgi:hypothetical protein
VPLVVGHKYANGTFHGANHLALVSGDIVRQTMNEFTTPPLQVNVLRT